MPRTLTFAVAFLCLCVCGCGTDEKQHEDFLKAARDWEEATMRNIDEGKYDKREYYYRIEDIINRGQPNNEALNAQKVIYALMEQLNATILKYSIADFKLHKEGTHENEVAEINAKIEMIETEGGFNARLSQYSERKYDQVKPFNYGTLKTP